MELPMAPKNSTSSVAPGSHDHHGTHDHHGHDHHHHHGHQHGHDHGSETQDYEQLLGISVTAILGMASLYLYFSDRLFLILAPKFHIWVLISGLGLLALTIARVWLLLSGHKGATCSHDHGTHDHGTHEHHDGCCHGDGGGHAHEHQSHAEGKQDHVHGEHCHHDHGKDHASCNHPEHDHHGRAHSHNHSHDHGHAHTHDHGHDHSHGSGFLPLQTMILLSPIVLLLGLPGEVFNSAQALSAHDVEASTRDVGDKGQDFEVTFLQLERAAANEETRNFYEGKTIRLTGRFVGDDDKRFTLIRYKINCCAADAVPLNSIIMVDPKYPERLPLQKLRNQWVEVTGKVQFLKKLGKEEYVSSLILHPEEGKTLDSIIKVVPPDANPYVN